MDIGYLKTSTHIIEEDLIAIYESLSTQQKLQFKNSTILVTGCCGFIGFYIMHFLAYYKKPLYIKRIIGLDNGLINNTLQWLDNIDITDVEFISFDIVKDDITTIDGYQDVDYILHLASIASPSFYRLYPVQTIDANVFGLRKLLDVYKDSHLLKGFLFFSTSEIYGNPPDHHIPTKEDYNGNVSTIGPRACYDESKRLGETLCYQFHHTFGMPITIVRAFNNYGAGLSLQDRRLPADFAKAVIAKQDIIIYSDGKPTRTFCYISDAISGYLKALVHTNFDIFNIGMDRPEISVKQLANIYIKWAKQLFDYNLSYCLQQHNDHNYLIHSPDRRCPNIDKARQLLQFNPHILVDDGVKRFLTFLANN